MTEPAMIEVLVPASPAIVEVAVPGLQGPMGDQGPPGGDMLAATAEETIAREIDEKVAAAHRRGDVEAKLGRASASARAESLWLPRCGGNRSGATAAEL